MSDGPASESTINLTDQFSGVCRHGRNVGIEPNTPAQKFYDNEYTGTLQRFSLGSLSVDEAKAAMHGAVSNLRAHAADAPSCGKGALKTDISLKGPK